MYGGDKANEIIERMISEQNVRNKNLLFGTARRFWIILKIFEDYILTCSKTNCNQKVILAQNETLHSNKVVDSRYNGKLEILE